MHWGLLDRPMHACADGGCNRHILKDCGLKCTSDAPGLQVRQLLEILLLERPPCMAQSRSQTQERGPDAGCPQRPSQSGLPLALAYATRARGEHNATVAVVTASSCASAPACRHACIASGA